MRLHDGQSALLGVTVSNRLGCPHFFHRSEITIAGLQAEREGGDDAGDVLAGHRAQPVAHADVVIGGLAASGLLFEVDRQARCAHQVGHLAEAIAERLTGLRESASYVLEIAGQDPNLSGAVAFNFLMQAGTVLGGWQLVRAARVAGGQGDAAQTETRRTIAEFYTTHVLPRADAYHRTVMTGADSVSQLPLDRF